MNQKLYGLIRLNNRLCYKNKVPEKISLSLRHSNKRIYMKFRSKPSTVIRKIMKFNGFKYSRRHKRWQAFVNVTRISKTNKMVESLNNELINKAHDK